METQEYSMELMDIKEWEIDNRIWMQKTGPDLTGTVVHSKHQKHNKFRYRETA